MFPGPAAEGVLERKGHICLIQLWTSQRAYVFDLHAMQPAERKDVLGLLEDELFGDDQVVKVRDAASARAPIPACV